MKTLQQLKKPAETWPLVNKVFLTLGVKVGCSGQSYLDQYCSLGQMLPKSRMSSGHCLIKMTLSFDCLLRRVMTTLP